MKYLFIGGPADGRRDEVPDWQHTIKVLAMNESPFSFVANKMSLSDVEYREVRNYLYYQHCLVGIDVFLYHGLSAREAMEILIRRYPQPLVEPAPVAQKPPIKFDFPADSPIINGNDDFMVTL